MYARDRDQPGSYRPFALEDLEDLRAAGDVFARVAGVEMVMLGTTEGETTRRAFGTLVTADYFATLGASLAFGRAFGPDEEKPGPATGGDREPPPLAAPRGRRGHARADGDHQRDAVHGGRGGPTGFTGTTAVVGPEFWLPVGAAAPRQRHAGEAGRVGRTSVPTGD